MLYSVSLGLVHCRHTVGACSDSVCGADLIVDKGRGVGICQVWLRMSQGIQITQRQYCAKYLMFSSYLNLIRPPGGRTISIFFSFFFFQVGNRLRSDKFAGATKTKHHRMGDLTGIYFLTFQEA